MYAGTGSLNISNGQIFVLPILSTFLPTLAWDLLDVPEMVSNADFSLPFYTKIEH
jgi:hypothetical protein